ncbi:LSM domain-containing [Hyphodiscus hymeniophilus]|uniref:LSM domain-containing n=1 Tax=Hyphodiscus hymeniophilus TaxID=353542 RepID=A0A9P6SQT6_9HELO|nr:LSM domain-containing [Hyphodiscus hymeniophilus]
MEKSQAEDYLRSLLNKTLRVTTSDTRMFLGEFKCTDSVSPAAQSSGSDSTLETVKLDMTSRYLGLVVVPGEYVRKIEVEEFVSQMRKGEGGV